jgi:branched-chain amino acid transport system ATP-binding protein
MLEGTHVSKSFGGLMAVSQADFFVGESEIVGLIGPNGAGKTTLFNLISGDLSPDAGTITFHEESITGFSPHRITRKGIARTFQSTRLFGEMTVYENVALALKFGDSGVSGRKAVHKEILRLLAFVGLLAERDKIAKDQPIANQKRVEIARALATNPRLLLLDEAMAGLNPVEIGQSMELVALIREQGITVFMIEHVMKAIMTVCDRIIVFNHGRNVAVGTPDEVASNPTVIEIYLGT